MTSAAQARSSKQGPPLQESVSYGSYAANTYFDPASNSNDAYFEILKEKRNIYRQQATENGERFVIGTLYKDDADAKLVTMGRDITGDGQPDLVVSEWKGGANCCLAFHIFEIGRRFRKIAEIDAKYGDQGPHFVHLDRGPGLQVQIYDWTFANWHSDFADSPAPKVILQYMEGTYRVSPRLMRSLRVDTNELDARVEKIGSEAKGSHDGSWPGAEVSSELWGTMLDLIYTGHGRRAWQFLEDAWPRNIRGKGVFRKDFCEQLKKSPYWESIQKLDGQRPLGFAGRSVTSNGITSAFAVHQPP
jgi:hypothetical protein